MDKLSRIRLPMISWPLRIAKDADFIPAFKKIIRTQFNENAEEFNKELFAFESLRNGAIVCTIDMPGLATLKQYYCQLMAMLTRFRDSEAKFTWVDCYSRTTTTGDLEFELNSIMFNLAALLAGLASKDQRMSENGMREACMNFQMAHWILVELRDSRQGAKTRDMSRDMLTFFGQVLIAQAQECLFEKSLQTNVSAANAAKLVAQIVDDYSSASVILSQSALLATDVIKEVMNSRMYTEWKRVVDFKISYYKSVVYYLSALGCPEEADKIGERIAWLQMAQSKFADATKLAKPIEHNAVNEAVKVVADCINKDLERSTKDNDYIYHAKVLTSDKLSDVRGFQIAKPLPFKPNPKEFRDIFASLVPLEAHEVSSVYSQKKDDLLRKVKKDVVEKDEELAQMMSRLNLEKRTLRPRQADIPDELIECCADLSMSGSNIVDDIMTKLEDIDAMAFAIHESLELCQKLIAKKPDPKFLEELARHKATHSKALQSNQTLHKSLTSELIKNIQTLASTNDPRRLLPDINNSITIDEENITLVEKLLDKVDEMKQQRARLCDQLRQAVLDDDVLNRVVASTSEDVNRMFDDELKKHDKHMRPLEQNLSTQDDLLDALERANAQYGSTRRAFKEYAKLRDTRLNSLLQSYANFKELSQSILQGLEYHNKMKGIVDNFTMRVRAAYEINDLMG